VSPSARSAPAQGRPGWSDSRSGCDTAPATRTPRRSADQRTHTRGGTRVPSVRQATGPDGVGPAARQTGRGYGRVCVDSSSRDAPGPRSRAGAGSGRSHNARTRQQQRAEAPGPAIDIVQHTTARSCSRAPPPHGCAPSARVNLGQHTRHACVPGQVLICRRPQRDGVAKPPTSSAAVRPEQHARKPVKTWLPRLARCRQRLTTSALTPSTRCTWRPSTSRRPWRGSRGDQLLIAVRAAQVAAISGTARSVVPSARPVGEPAHVVEHVPGRVLQLPQIPVEIKSEAPE